MCIAICNMSPLMVFVTLLFVVIAVLYHVYARRMRVRSIRKAESLSETKYMNLVDLLPQMVFEVDTKGRFSLINNSGRDLTAYTRIDIEKGIRIHDIMLSEDKKAFAEEFLYNMEGGRNKGQEFRIVSKTGRIVPMRFYMSRILADGRITGMRGIAIDVSEEKRLEQQLITAIIDTEDRERKRFSEDLHDGLGPLLSTIKLYVNQMNSDDVGPHEQKEMMRYTNELLDESISNTKSIANNILPGTISDNGLIPALNSFFNRIHSLGQLKINFQHKLYTRLRPSVENTLYRILNELMNNTLKHSGATFVDILISVNKGWLEMSYQDNGKGFDIEAVTKGLGLENIQSRARSIHAKTSMHSEPGKGFHYELRMQID